MNGLDPSGRLTVTLVDLLMTGAIVGLLSGVIAGTVSAMTGGSFAEGFFKGLIAGAVTAILSLFEGPSFAGAIGNAIAQAVVTEWYIEGFREPELSWIRIGLAALLGAIFGFASTLPKMEALQVSWLEVLKSVEMQGFKEAFDQLLEEGLKFLAWRSFCAVSVAVVNIVSRFVLAVWDWASRLGRSREIIRTSLQKKFGDTIPGLGDNHDYGYEAS